ncbi:MAG: DNA repair protein RecO [bacterium]|nr:DNA repair protein RecO [bacterium]
MSASRYYKAQAVILKRRSVGETDRIITLFTREHGKISAVARGVRRISSRRAGHIEVFSHVSVTLYHGKTMDTVIEVERRLPWADLPVNDLWHLSHSYYICELVDKLLPERQRDVDVYESLTSSLQKVFRCKSVREAEETVYTFALSLLWSLGYLPRSEWMHEASVAPFIERIIERRLHTWALLKKIG